jgi:4-hydroxyacetophenone monooxygenase
MNKLQRDIALKEASVPTLLMCLAQITRDPTWLQDPFLPKRDISIFAEPSGGLSPQVQQTIRDSLSKVLDELDSGVRSLPPPPTEAELVEMMSVCLGERVPAEYAPMALEEMGFRDRRIDWRTPSPPARLADFKVLVIGAGFTGLCAAWRFKQMGLNFEVVDKNTEVGGTWFENNYPEAGVDTPNHFYSYSFSPNLRWSSNYSKRDEVVAYQRKAAGELGVLDRIEFNTKVEELRWNNDLAKTAAIRGLDQFAGPLWHSARWRHDVSLEGKRIAVVGTGASAMQFLRSVAARAAKVTVFQRSPQWARPPQDYHGTVSTGERWLLENIPYYYAWYRFGLMWRFGDGLLPTVRRDPSWPNPERAMNYRNDRQREQMTEYLLQQLEGRPDLVAKCLPDYPPYGKRILIDNGWYQALKRPNVELVTEAVDRIEADAIIAADGSRHEVDVIILATGFEAAKMLGSMTVLGRSGQPLEQAWADDDPRAFLGITVPDYPNLFVAYGPNTGLAHGGSLIFVIECQVRYITTLLCRMIERNIDRLEVRRDVHDRFIERVDAEHAELVWTHPGMNNWYRNQRGRVFGPMPFRLVDYWTMTREPDLRDYETNTQTAPAIG